jgi:hypothetical protein
MINQLTRRGLFVAYDIGNGASYGGGSSVLDLKGNATLSMSTVNSPTFSTNNWGILTLNGSTQYLLTIRSVLIDPGAANFSSGALFKTPASNPANLKTIFAYYPDTAIGSGNWQFYLDTNGKIVGFIRDFAGNTITTTSTLSYADGAWHDVFIVRSGTTLSLYIDGAFVTSSTNASLSSLTNLNNRLFIGLLSTVNNTSYYPGSIAAACHYTTDITAQEVLLNHQYWLKRTLH